jgi:hypothetical protein
MKRLIIISLLAFVALAVNAQQGYQTFKADTVKGAQTKYVTSSVNCQYSGYATFDFTLKGFGASDSATVTLQGKNQGTTWFTVGSQIQVYKSNVATDYQLIANPVQFLSYRLKFQGKATDTVRISAPLFIYKR